MRRQTYGYLPSRRASPPLDRYQIILLGDRDTCVWTTCPRLLPESGTAENENENKSNKKTDQLLMFCLAMALNISRPHFCLTLYLLTTLFSGVVKRGRSRGWREWWIAGGIRGVSSIVFTCIGALATPSRTALYCRSILLVFVRSRSSINNKIISFKKLFNHSQLEALQKEKNPLAKTALVVTSCLLTLRQRTNTTVTVFRRVLLTHAT